MESFSLLFDSQSPSSSRRSWTYDILKNFRQISPVVQTHLIQVYILLCCALTASAIGAYHHIIWNIGGFLTFFASLICMYSLLTTPSHEETKRVSLLMAFSLLHGATLGPLIKLTIDIDPSILVSAFMATAIVFACFSGVALLARRRVFLYLVGPLSSGLLTLLWLFFASVIFDGSAALFVIEAIIERAHLGDLDYVRDALLLFIDFMCVFSRIVEIIVKEKEEKKKERE